MSNKQRKYLITSIIAILSILIVVCITIGILKNEKDNNTPYFPDTSISENDDLDKDVSSISKPDDNDGDDSIILVETPLDYDERVSGVSDVKSDTPTPVTISTNEEYIENISANAAIITDANMILSTNTIETVTTMSDGTTTQSETVPNISLFSYHIIVNNVDGWNAMCEYSQTGIWPSGYEAIGEVCDSSSESYIENVKLLSSIIINFSTSKYDEIKSSLLIPDAANSFSVYGQNNKILTTVPLFAIGNVEVSRPVNIYDLIACLDETPIIGDNDSFHDNVEVNIYSCDITLDNIYEYNNSSKGCGNIINSANYATVSNTIIRFNNDIPLDNFGIIGDCSYGGTFDNIVIQVKGDVHSISDAGTLISRCQYGDITIQNIIIENESISVEMGNGGILFGKIDDNVIGTDGSVKNVFANIPEMEVSGLSSDRWIGNIENPKPTLTKVPVISNDSTIEDSITDIIPDDEVVKDNVIDNGIIYVVDPSAATSYMSGNTVVTVYNLAIIETVTAVDSNTGEVLGVIPIDAMSTVDDIVSREENSTDYSVQSMDENSTTSSTSTEEEYEWTLVYPEGYDYYNEFYEIIDIGAFNDYALEHSYKQVQKSSNGEYTMSYLSINEYEPQYELITHDEISSIIMIKGITKDATLYIARYADTNQTKLIDMYTESVTCDETFMIEFAKSEDVRSVALYLWDGMTPLKNKYVFTP